MKSRLSVVGYTVFLMTAITFDTPGRASSPVGELLTGAAALQNTEFWKMLPDDLLAFGRDLEQLSRLVYAAQVHLTGEIDTAGLAAAKSYSSTPALLRQAYNISPAEATGRVKAARQILPRETMTGPDAPPLLPVLGGAVQAGRLDPEHIRTVIDTMGKIPTAATAELRDACEQALVGVAVDADPKFLERAATVILEHADPDGTLDKDPPATRIGLDIGSRNIRTGLTPIKGHLDDLGIEAVRKAIDALAAPHPAADGTPDTRSPANRRAHALVQAMLGYLAAGNGPTSGGQRPQVTVILDWDAITGLITDARFDTGGYVSPAQARQLLCDAVIIPAVLGTDSEILDVGRSSRTFPPAIRRALALRDRGCAWPDCDRPPGWCDAHHIAFWSRDLGPTSLDDGVLFCPYHHTEIHREQWRVIANPGGRPQFIPPRWIDPEQKPRINTLHHFTINPL
jgi:hypothetical protein